MKSHITKEFRQLFQNIPEEVKEKAREAYRLWLNNSRHPSLHFKKVHQQIPLYSVRIGINWRALGLLEKGAIYWFWIGSHEDYNKKTKEYQKYTQRHK